MTPFASPASSCWRPTSAWIARQTDSIVRITQGRRERRPVTDGAPRIGMAPRAAAAHAPRADGWPQRIRRRGARVVVVGVPVGAPLVADAGEVEEPERVGRRGAHARRTREPSGGGLAGPRQAAVGDAAARGLFPLRLR